MYKLSIPIDAGGGEKRNPPRRRTEDVAIKAETIKLDVTASRWTETFVRALEHYYETTAGSRLFNFPFCCTTHIRGLNKVSIKAGEREEINHFNDSLFADGKSLRRPRNAITANQKGLLAHKKMAA